MQLSVQLVKLNKTLLVGAALAALAAGVTAYYLYKNNQK